MSGARSGIIGSGSRAAATTAIIGALLGSTSPINDAMHQVHYAVTEERTIVARAESVRFKERINSRPRSKKRRKR